MKKEGKGISDKFVWKPGDVKIYKSESEMKEKGVKIVPPKKSK